MAAFKSGRNAISIEREATYIEMIKKTTSAGRGQREEGRAIALFL